MIEHTDQFFFWIFTFYDYYDKQFIFYCFYFIFYFIFHDILLFYLNFKYLFNYLFIQFIATVSYYFELLVIYE